MRKSLAAALFAVASLRVTASSATRTDEARHANAADGGVAGASEWSVGNRRKWYLYAQRIRVR